jgi:type IV pilus assembly protein PilY1
MKPATRFLSVLILIAGSGSVTLADDTDIYLDPQTAGPPPMVMFSLDYRSNVTSTSCNHSTNTMEDIRDDCGFSELLAQILFDDNAGADEKISLYEMIRAALQVVVEDLDGVSVGLMMSHHDDNDCEGPGQTGCSNGAMIMQGFRPLEDGDANGNKAAFLALLRSIPDEPDPDAPDRQNVDYHPYQPKEMYFEFFRYLTGQAVYNGHNGWTDFDTGTDARNLAANAVADAAITAADPAADAFRELKHPGFTNTGSVTYPSWDETIEDAGHTEYVSPLAGNDCVSVFAINIGFGTDNNDADSDDAMALPIADGGLNLVFDESNEFAQLVRYMNDANFGDGTWPNIAEIDGEQNLISYFIMDSANSTQDEWADAGGTGQAIELGENPDVVVETINNIFKSILSVSTTFVAPSVPVNVFNRAQTVDEVFLALFEAEVTPLWSGNLKKIKIGTRDTVDGNGNAITVTELQDANGDQAIDVDGRLRRDALTFWTDAGTLPDPPLEEDEVVDKDGRAIKRGAAGQQIAGVAAGNPELTNATAGARQLYTEDIGNTAGITGDTDNSDQLMPLDATVEVATEVWQELAIDSGLSAAADYASATNDEQDEAIDNLEFARGLQDDGATPRDWMMADPLHSRPRTINYGIRTAGYNMDNPDIRIVIGTNEGYMRMFRNTTTGVPDPDTLNVQDGSETWAFMPRAANQRCQQRRQPQVRRRRYGVGVLRHAPGRPQPLRPRRERPRYAQAQMGHRGRYHRWFRRAEPDVFDPAARQGKGQRHDHRRADFRRRL